jgi:uncharacterized protein with ParB-like and HNH nuclease domain
MNVWKIATRWSGDGNPNSSVLDIFRKYQVVFAGREIEYIKNQVKPGDYIALSDGLNIVSVGKVLSDPKKLTDFEFSEEDIASDRFDYEGWVIAFKVQLIDLLPEEVFSYRQGTFHAIHGEYKEKVISFYNNSFIETVDESKFAIFAKTCTLGVNPQSPEDTIFGKSRKYIIPIYQRPYSWTEDQITKFLTDIFKSYHGYDKISRPEPMFIGTMQLSAPRYDKVVLTEQDIVDGQQRLSTFLILLKVLKSKYVNIPALRNISFDWIETRVNNGEQQKLISEFLSLSLAEIQQIESQNRYVLNARLIDSFIETELKEEDDAKIEFSIESFINHLLSNIYFVVIETHAGLSKTLQIFNAINTTGLDLNGGDVFKIRMYEYMRDKQNYGEEAFELISELYAKIDSENKSNGYNLSINQILSSYQNLLIARHKLPPVLFELGTETFFERLFDTIFLINEWKNFSKVRGIEFDLQLSELNELLNFHILWRQVEYPTFEDYCMMHAIWHSRYGKHWNIIFLFLYRFKNEPNKTQMMFDFIKKLSKLFVTYSVIFDKAIGNIHSFVYSLTSKLIDEKEKFEEILKFIDGKQNGLIPYFNQPNKEVFQSSISGNIFYNHKKKGLLCRLSAMLEEDYQRSYSKDEEISNLFSNDKLDIEHIESFNHKDENERNRIHTEWGFDLLNSIGNLMVLEYDINRGAASNNPYEIKVQESCYLKSKYSIVHKQVSDYEEWNKVKCESRKEKEIDKLSKYFFS